MLGYGGHFSTKSRHYFTPLGGLRQARTDHRAEQARLALGLPDPVEDTTISLSEWRFTRHGEAFWAELTRQWIETARRIARERSGAEAT